MKEELRFIISGGGTGGHIFPAVSIANAIKAQCPKAQILFVGAEGRMEMQRVPEAGYPIKGLPICGFDRKNPLRNISVLFKIAKSQWMARHIIKDFRPMAVVGVGGYASGPTLKTAAMIGIPTLIQEQNSYAGVTNKLLAKKANKICVAYEGMERFFPTDKIIMTGNPVRQNLLGNSISQKEAAAEFGFDDNKKIVLIVGGSLGARTMNESILQHLDEVSNASDIQFIWQTGKYYFPQIQDELKTLGKPNNLFVTDFISNMDAAYGAADLVISRAGASSISEFCLLGKPVILVPSPNVSEDHQTKNALALVHKNAALYVKDAEAERILLGKAIETVRNEALLKDLSEHILKLALHDSANVIATEVIKLAEAYLSKQN